MLDKQSAESFFSGNGYDAYSFMGGRICEGGATFTVWAPHAHTVRVVVNDAEHALEAVHGLWHGFVREAHVGDQYTFLLTLTSGVVITRDDPFKLTAEMRPGTQAILHNPFVYEWHDSEWMEKRDRALEKPMNIYELHIGSWKRPDTSFPNFREVAHEVVQYCVKMKYTHVEVMPVSAHPLDESWGYQVTGYYAVTSRYGSPTDFQYFVDTLHQHGIGVILDWVPGHFPKDEGALAQFDGTPLFEHPDPHKGYHPQWTTNIFDYGKPEVQSFLISSALYYLELFHVDGLRVDAVSSMVYLDYERKEGEWTPNEQGGREHIEAIGFIKKLNRAVHERNPNVFMIAEESHAFPNVTIPIDQEGLGFDLKWNLGWMNDTLSFFRTPYEQRVSQLYHLHQPMSFMFQEKFLLVLSHDEVVHMKGSMFGKMPGTDEEKFLSLRMLYTYMLTFPGKKLMFMGGEFGMRAEWDCKGALDWHLLEQEEHLQLQNFVAALNELYLSEDALWHNDVGDAGYQAIVNDKENECVVSYARRSKKENLLIIHNFLPREQKNCLVHFLGDMECILSSNPAHPKVTLDKHPDGLLCTLPPLTSVICRQKMNT